MGVLSIIFLILYVYNLGEHHICVSGLLLFPAGKEAIWGNATCNASFLVHDGGTQKLVTVVLADWLRERTLHPVLVHFSLFSRVNTDVGCLDTRTAVYIYMSLCPPGTSGANEYCRRLACVYTKKISTARVCVWTAT